MILPIHTVGKESLRTEAQTIEQDSEALRALIQDMFETMDNANGIGLAAPQVGHNLRLFTVDLTPLSEKQDRPTEGRMVFINPEIVWESEEETVFEEGCLSIPGLQAEVVRPERIRVAYLDENFESREIEASEMLARVIQHEYDHLEGVLFIDHLSPFRKRMLQRRLKAMIAGQVEAEYPVLTPKG